MLPTLRTRLILAFASVTLVSLLVALVGFLFLIRDREINAARERVGQLVDPVAWSVGNLAQQGATEQEIAQYLDERAQTLQVRFLLLDSNSTILQDSGRQLAGQTLDMSKQTNLRLSGGQNGFAFVTQEVAGTRQVLFQPSPFVPLQLVTVPNVVPTRYQILMLVPEQNLSEVWRQLAQRTLVAAGAGLLLTVTLSVLIARSIVRPLARMTQASEEMARGHYQQRIESKRRDEVGRLAAAFNAMAAEVSHSDQMMRDLLANVAHELKTPLTSIQGFSQALSEGAVHSRDEYERAGRIINEEADRMRRLVEDLLYLSQIESGQVSMEHRPVDVRALLYNSLERVSHRASDGGQILELAAAENLPPIIGDERRLEQVLGNLLDNALRYTPRGGYIRLAARSDAGRVSLSVRNTGSYIPLEDQNRVFERFYRVERSRSGRNGGLGLAIVSEIVAAHGGTVDV
ncbi:MAG TPA: ATP-binding protein, partial [Dehalococcoidia bacterium]|nr:ATP-binding protein [Dehalococcoidia bacterium]